MLSQWIRRFGAAAIAVAALFTGSSAFAQADVTVIHGIPGLPAPVEVCVNGAPAFTFDFPEQQAVQLPAGNYFLEVKLNGTPVLDLTVDLEDGVNYTVIAHQTFIDGVDSGLALSPFVNDASPVGGWWNTRATVRHTADAPAVDIDVQRTFSGNSVVFIEGLTNNDGEGPTQAGPVEPFAGFFSAEIFPAGASESLVTIDLGFLAPRRAYIVYAVGSLSGGTFQLISQVINPTNNGGGGGGGDDDDDDGGDDDDDDGGNAGDDDDDDDDRGNRKRRWRGSAGDDDD